ncbi:MAG: DNA topoisomerase (ATP-hydrolyzing) [Planctomycetota bacterium]
MAEPIGDVALRTAARQKYLNYAMSVITARALPDVRDGLKPVQRRILYAMYADLRLLPDRKELKCAKVVGEVLGNYHPHGDSAVYEALVRMAQPFVLRAPLVNGHGNFGSIDGDSAAAYRYTEAKLRPFALTLLDEIDQETVPFRDTFDAVRVEPVVLPAQAPVLLVNGVTGIAVGIATNIPPHNLREVCAAAIQLIRDPEASVAQLLRSVKGPDFPVGCDILASKAEIRKVYETGSGPITMRGRYEIEGKGKKRQIVITTIPHMVKKQEVVGKIRDLALDRKVPQIVDVRDESTTDIRIVLELKADADPDVVMAYLFKNTDLRCNFNYNMTALVPREGTEIAVPEQLDLRSMLRHFLRFRFDVVTRRFEYELRQLEKRIHILEGFRKIFDDLDTAIRIIRESKGKKDAGEGLMAHFGLDEIQTNAILELMLYRIATLEIQRILDELREKKARAAEIRRILSSETTLWSIVRGELEVLAKEHGDDRRSRIIEPAESDAVEIKADDFIVEEDAFVVLSEGGWLKRVGSVKSVDKIPVKKGDAVFGLVAGSTRSSVVFFSNLGVAYTARIHDIPASRGFGDPIQKLFRFKDGERVVAMFSLDPRAIGDISAPKNPEHCPAVHGLAITTSGHGMRFGLLALAEPSTRVGRKFARLKAGHEIVRVFTVHGKETLITVSAEARALLCPAEEINYLEGPGQGVYVLKVGASDRVIGAAVTDKDHLGLTAVTTNGTPHNVNPRRYKVTGRGGKGFEVIKRGGFASVQPIEIELPTLGGE